MTLAATTIGDIVLNATEDDLDRIIAAIKERRKVLATARASEVQVGMACTLTGLSPKYLNGLTGTVVRDPQGRSGARSFACKLDEASTKTLRWQASSRFYIAEGVTEYVLPGVPMQCFKVS